MVALALKGRLWHSAPFRWTLKSSVKEVPPCEKNFKNYNLVDSLLRATENILYDMNFPYNTAADKRAL